MSRYYSDGDYDEDFPNQAALWRANAGRAMNGKRGRKVLAELREALLNLPAKRLISSALCTVNPETRAAKYDDRYGFYSAELNEIVAEQGEGVCAIGAYLWWQKVKAGADPTEAFETLPTILPDEGGLEETASLAKREAGVVFSMAWDLAYMNDEQFESATPEQRYDRFMEWLDSKLAVGAL